MRKNSKKIKAIAPSIITAEMHVIGDIAGEGAIDIAGRIDGSIRCLSVKLSEGASVSGDIVAEKAEIHGEVRGNVTAKTIICGRSAKIVGDIVHQRINIEDGAYVDGNCKKFVIEDSVETIPQPEENAAEEPATSNAEVAEIVETAEVQEEIKRAS